MSTKKQALTTTATQSKATATTNQRRQRSSSSSKIMSPRTRQLHHDHSVVPPVGDLYDADCWSSASSITCSIMSDMNETQYSFGDDSAAAASSKRWSGNTPKG